MGDLIPRQEEIWRHIAGKVEPVANVSVRDLAAAFGIRSSNGMHCHLLALEAKGYIKRNRGRKGIRVLKRPEE